MRWIGKKLVRRLILLIVLGYPMEVLSADQLSAFERWREYDERSTMHVDHRPWEAFLLNYLRPGGDGVHRIAYGNVNDRDRRALNGYIEAMSVVDISAYRRPEQMAYWINLYNALVVKLVLDHYPIASIRNLERPGAGSKGSPGSGR